MLVQEMGYFLLELASYLIGFICIMKLYPRKKYLLILYILLAVSVHMIWVEVLGISTFNLAAAIGGIYPIICKEKWNKQIVYFYFIMLLSGTLCYGLSNSIITRMIRMEVLRGDEGTNKLYCFILFPICLLLYQLSNYMVRKDGRQISLLREQKITIIIALACGINGLALYELMDMNQMNLQKRMISSEICFVVVLIIFLFTVIWQGRVIWLNQELEKKQIVYEFVTKNQEQHLDEIVKKDHEIRKFRHDIRAHMIILKDLVEKEDKEGILLYLEEMNQFTKKGETLIFSGNSIVDSILNELNEKMKQLDIQLTLHGQLQLEDRNRSFDIAICVYNIVMNAIEALEKMERSRNIEIFIEQFQKKVYMQVKNQCQLSDGVLRASDLVTHKEDKKNHGIGSRNVQDIVERNGGRIEYAVKNGWFEVELLI